MSVSGEKKKRAVILWVGAENRMFEVSGLRLPFFLGGAQKSIAENVKILQRDHDVALCLLGLRRVPDDCHAPGLRIISIPPLFGAALPSVNLLRMLASAQPFGFSHARREGGVVLIHSHFISAILCKLMLPRWRVCVVVEGRFRNLAWSPYVPSVPLRLAYFVCALLSVLIVDRVLVDSNQTWPMTAAPGLLRAKTRYIPNSIDPELFRPAGPRWRPAALRQTPQASVLLYVGRLDFEQQKDPELLFRAFALARQRRSSLHLVIAGVDRHVFQSLVRRYNDGQRENIHLVGTVANDALPRVFRGGDLTLLTSRYEGTPYAILESLACGTPAVTTPVVEPGVIDHGISGFVSAPDPTSFADAIHHGLELSERLRNAGRRGLLPRGYQLTMRDENLRKALWD